MPAKQYAAHLAMIAPKECYESSLLICTFFFASTLWAPALEYEKDIMPVFKKKCFKCHSDKAGKAKAGLRLDETDHFYARFGKNELVQSGNPKMSNLYYSLTRPRHDEGAMPPKNKGKQLTEAEVKMVHNWILEGAPINGKRGKRNKLLKEEKGLLKSTPDMPRLIEWSNREGKTILATFLKIEGNTAVLRLKNGRIYPCPIERLSERSLDKLSRLSASYRKNE